MSETSENPVVQAHREVIERLWTRPVLDACESDLPCPDATTVLAAEARCGEVVLRWLPQLSDDTRMMVLDTSGPMLDEARSRVAESDRDRLFFVEERVRSLSYADGVFDAAVCVHGLVTRRQITEGLGELVRVVSSGGTVVMCVPLNESFAEIYDLFDEALRSCGLEQVLPRLYEAHDRLATPHLLASMADEQPLVDFEVSQLEWEIGFGDGRDYLYSPLIQETVFPQFVGAVRSSEREPVLEYVEEAIDIYWSGRDLTTEVNAGLLVAEKA